jgi:outer membrane protein OmpA-like peptidoglycan-associated protein
MPEVHKKADIPELRPDQIPQIPQTPPTAPSFPGFDVPTDANLPDAVRPNYDLTDIKGTAFHFVPQSDQLSSGQDAALAKIVQKWPNGPLTIRGFGDAASMSPQDQADAVRLGLLRAQRLAVELTGRGIPASAITVRGDAFGTGAKVVTPP